MHEDFRGQDLRGRSFKGLDLSYADFSDARLGSCDFSGATLTGAKFCRARFGLSLKMQTITLMVRLLCGSLAGLFITIGFSTYAIAIQAILNWAHSSTTTLLNTSTIAVSILTCYIGWLAIDRNRLVYLLWFALGWIATAFAMLMTAIIVGIGAGQIITPSCHQP